MDSNSVFLDIVYHRVSPTFSCAALKVQCIIYYFNKELPDALVILTLNQDYGNAGETKKISIN